MGSAQEHDPRNDVEDSSILPILLVRDRQSLTISVKNVTFTGLDLADLFEDDTTKTMTDKNQRTFIILKFN